LENNWHPKISTSRPEYWTEFDRITAECGPEELHAFADRWNWDQGDEPIWRAGRYLFCVVIEFPDGNGFPVTARPMTAQEKRKYRKWRDQ
jgi:hypothetical protein